jgi:hypothetical protein
VPTPVVVFLGLSLCTKTGYRGAWPLTYSRRPPEAGYLFCLLRTSRSCTLGSNLNHSSFAGFDGDASSTSRRPWAYARSLPRSQHPSRRLGTSRYRTVAQHFSFFAHLGGGDAHIRDLQVQAGGDAAGDNAAGDDDGASGMTDRSSLDGGWRGGLFPNVMWLWCGVTCP